MDLIDKDFKSAIKNIFQELKETMPKQLKFETISWEVGNINKEIEIAYKKGNH